MVIWLQSAILHSLQSESHTKQCIALHCNVDVEDEGMQNEVKCDISMYREVKWVGIEKVQRKRKGLLKQVKRESHTERESGQCPPDI